MSKAFIEELEDIFDFSESVENTGLFPTEEDLLILYEKFSGFEIPTNVFLQAIAIAAYDRASAFRYADYYVNVLKNENKRQNLLALEDESDFENN
ncbi:hypothetical protein ACF3DV_14530 [Chlorogloeopsis fritschii PCC 9212]|uniref:Uncharacterized protein n=1 Tax=Chlorogloeopsis fritschii PCC 6912 TaxID=211165 RepID=A0A3S0Y877_CHLFR|nr:hypothetical protein [Chlorogloeopsis fritschii]MBF2005001.1 hypothetical protein [Chlorogloeopsis fritschii C42_A2020_084]RUR86622.1 hypothetical protein PCC6912_00650 [Chlorogloeopsis fritschii PCC 6912]